MSSRSRLSLGPARAQRASHRDAWRLDAQESWEAQCIAASSSGPSERLVQRSCDAPRRIGVGPTGTAWRFCLYCLMYRISFRRRSVTEVNTPPQATTSRSIFENQSSARCSGVNASRVDGMRHHMLYQPCVQAIVSPLPRIRILSAKRPSDRWRPYRRDACGEGFLKSYIREDYATLLSTFGTRGIVFVRASSCTEPGLVQPNEASKSPAPLRRGQDSEARTRPSQARPARLLSPGCAGDGQVGREFGRPGRVAPWNTEGVASRESTADGVDQQG